MIKLYDKNKNLFAELNYGKEYFSNYGLHSHETFCFSLVAKGEVGVKIHNKKELVLKKDMLVVFNINQTHKTSKTKLKAYDYFTLHLNKNICKKLQNEVFKTNEEFIELENFIYETSLYENFLEIFYGVLNNTYKHDDLEKALKKLFLNATLKNQNPISYENKLLEKIEEFLLKNIYTPISLEEISQELGYSSSYITRIFKKKHGLSPHAFLVNKRVEKARNLLLINKNIDLATLSQEVCFFDQSHFTKAFKKNYSISPKKYINSPKVF